MRQNSAKLCHLLQKDAVSPPLCHQAAFQESATATRQTHYVLLRIYVGKLQQLLQFLGVTVYGFCPQ